MDRESSLDRQQLSRLLELVAEDSVAGKLGLLQIRIEKYPEAYATFEKAVNLSRSTEREGFYTSRKLIALFRQGKVNQSETLLKQFNDRFKKEDGFKSWMAELMLERGKIYLSGKDFELALEDFEKVYKLDPDVKKVMDTLAIIRRDSGDAEGAVELYERLLSQADDERSRENIIGDMARLYIGEGEPDTIQEGWIVQEVLPGRLPDR